MSERDRALALARARRRRAEEQPADPRNSVGGMVDTFMRGAADTMGLGLSDEISAGLGALTGIGGEAGNFSGNLEQQRAVDTADAENRGWTRMAGQAAGGIAGGLGLARAGLSLGANAASAGQGLVRTMIGSGIDGAILGALQGAGSGEGLEGRAVGAVGGGLAGGAVGALAPAAVAGVSAGGRAIAAPIMARLRPDVYAERALGEGVRRSGQSVDDIVAALTRSQADDQGMFNVADAMGHQGGRMMSTVTRNPNDMRQTVVDTLNQRQMGQGERIIRALTEGFDAPDTAAQRTTALTSSRNAAADVAYEAARQGAGAVDVSGALAAADDILMPGVSRLANPVSGIADDSLEGVVRRARSLLSDGQSNLTDFTSVLRARQDIGDMIGAAQRQGRGNQVRLLSRISRELDGALERASPAYRSANDSYAAASRTIDAVDTGRNAASARTRAADNIAAFNAMPAQDQAAFRAGYVDPMAARVESASISPSTNKARMLMTEKTGQEFPAFAVPGRADQMGRRIAREQRMFETANAALGGSRTADNLADAAAMSQYDPGILMNLVRGRPVAAALDAVARAANEARGMPPSVIDRIARALIETDPNVAGQTLRGGARQVANSDRFRGIVAALLTNLGASASGRLVAP